MEYNGIKIVLKNNTPTCVLMKPSAYEAMVEALEDYALYFEAEQRKASSDNRYLVEETFREPANFQTNRLYEN